MVPDVSSCFIASRCFQQPNLVAAIPWGENCTDSRDRQASPSFGGMLTVNLGKTDIQF